MRTAILSSLQLLILALVLLLGLHVFAIERLAEQVPDGSSVELIQSVIANMPLIRTRSYQPDSKLQSTHPGVDKIIVVESRLPGPVFDSMVSQRFLMKDGSITDSFGRYDRTVLHYIWLFGLLTALFYGLFLHRRESTLLLTDALTVAVGIGAAWALESPLLAGAAYQVAAVVVGVYIIRLLRYLRQDGRKPSNSV